MPTMRPRSLPTPLPFAEGGTTPSPSFNSYSLSALSSDETSRPAAGRGARRIAESLSALSAALSQDLPPSRRGDSALPLLPARAVSPTLANGSAIRLRAIGGLGTEIAHRAKVGQAVKEGKSVPDEVLAEYPELRHSAPNDD